MAVMKRLRDNTHVILWAFLIIFILSMTIGGLVGGANIMDIFSKEKKLQGKAGVVNGKEFDGMQYSRLIQNELDRIRESGQEITEDVIQRISDQIWESFINETLIAEEVKRLGLEATDWEVYEYLMQYPPDFLINQEVFLTDGQFDQQKYVQALTNPQGNEWIGIEQYLRGLLPFQKIRNLVENLAVVTDGEVLNEYTKTKVPFTLETLLFPYPMVSSDSFYVSESEIKAYYKNHKEDYFVEETRQMDYVFFELKPSPADSLTQYELAVDLKNRIEAGESFETVAIEYTEDPSGKNSGGDLGWFDRNQMVKPFSEAAFSLRRGEISDPVLTNFGYHIIKIEDKRTQNRQDQVKARHILLKITIGPETLDKLRSKANLFAFDASDFGFEAAADSHKMEIKSTNTLNKNSRYITDLGTFTRAVRFAFADNPVGTLSELMGAKSGYALFKLTKVNPEHYKPLEDVSDAIRSTILVEKRSEHLGEIASNVYKQLGSEQSLEFAVQSYPEIKYELHNKV
ncbi:MAG: peptidylprolyl isomerase, partial [Candidatus Marinimicrobia bacterium]|nr:peptidylprolyl isomerase [Candidatus Neomarinimicrobiota bacterium]